MDVDGSESRSRREERKSSKPSNNTRDRSPLSKTARKGAPDRRVFVSNIPYEFRWQDLKDLFRDEVGEVAYVELFTDEKNKPRGCGIVEFDKAENVQLAIEKMHRFELKGRKLVVREDTATEHEKLARRSTNSISSNQPPPRSQWSVTANAPTPSNYGNTYGLSPQFLESLGIHGPLINKIFVANLDYKVDEKKLREVFKLAGRVINVDLLTDKEGKSRGFGTVEFEHPVEAVQAISMLHNQLLYDRRINVRMDKSNENDGPVKLPDGLKGVGMGLGANGAPLSDVSRNLPSLNLSSIQPAPPTLPAAASLSASAPSALAALGEYIYLNQQLDSRLLDSALVRRQLELVGGLSSNLLNKATDFAGLGSGSLTGSVGSGLNVSNSSSSGGGPFLKSGNPFVGSSGNSLDSIGSANLRQPERHRDTIIVKNLPSSTTWKILRDLFREAGDIKFAEMKTRDVGIVQFSTDSEAKRAISIFDNYRCEGKKLAVELF
ncbi:hypothetical protein V9T40_002423 [Parthenolecanium corni]|uniref:RRM domain-containing protein n=1 Tax=Parthenolecanium corni TaxID=536013 RepID=A0AAN9TGP2_9HEMI